MVLVRFTVMMFLFFGNFLAAQIPGMRIYDESDGYTASIGYIINQDRTGFIWIGSNKGAIQFDGHCFNVFDERKGLKDKDVTQAQPCNGDFVLITPLINALAYYHKGKIINEDQDSLLRQPNNVGMNHVISDLYTESCWLGDQSNQGFLYRFHLGKLEKVALHVKQPFSLLSAYNDWLVLQLKKELSLYHVKTHRQLDFSLQGDSSFFKSLSQWTFSPDGQYLLAYSREKQQLALYSRKSIHQLRFVHAFPAPLIPKQILVDQYGGLWTTYKETGVHFWGNLSKGNLRESPLTLFSSTVINHVFSDRDQNLWFTTKRKGLYFIAAPQWKNYLRSLHIGVEPALTTVVGSNGVDHVFLGFENYPQLGIIQHGKFSAFPLSSGMSEGIHTLAAERNFLSISSPGGYLNLINILSDGLRVEKALNLSGSVKDLHLQTENQTLYVASNYGAQSIALNTPEPSSLTSLFPPAHRSTAILSLQNTLLLGTPDGLYKRNATDTAFTKVGDKLLQDANITDIANFDAHTALIGTMADGLHQFHYPTGSSSPVRLNQHQRPGVIHQIFRETPTRYWLATDQGVYSTVINGNVVEQSKHYGFADGLPSSSVSSLCVLHDTLYAATSSGLGIVPVKSSKAPSTHPVVILSARIGDSSMFQPQVLSFSYPTSNITFTFSAFAFSRPGKVEYRYRLEGQHTPWIKSTTPIAHFSDLTPGRYVFSVGVVRPNKVYETPLSQISIIIHPAFWQTIWFKTACVLLFLCIAAGILHYILKKRRKKAFLKVKHKRKLAELELEAIKAQINPHFIGNCLNSIQYLAYQHNYESVGLYLDHFSSLIRQTMQLSQKMFTPLQDELAYLTNYLKLEKMRFKERLNYFIQVEKGISKMRLLPAMLLQPYVENALKHGGVHQGKPGEITIAIHQLPDDYLKVCITDNGIGINKKTLSRNRKKLGLRLSGSRVKTYNELFHLGIELSIMPISAIEGNDKPGTVVQLIIPPINHEDTNV